MAYRRSLSTRATLIARAYNNPSFSYILHDHHDRDNNRDSTLSRREVHNFIQQRSSFGRLSQFSVGSAFIRYMSTSVGEGGGSDNKTELMSNVADVVSDATVTTQVNEVAIAAADSFWPEHFIDPVHNFTGLDWLVVATLLCRYATFPLLIHQLKALFEVKKKQMEEDKATNPEAVADCQKQMQKAHKENCTGTYRAFIRPTWVYIDYAVITGCFLAVSFMAKTFPDSFYIWPFLAGQSLLIATEDTMQKFTIGDRHADTLRFITTGLAVPLVLSTVDCPKAICYYLITSNLFALAYVLVKVVLNFIPDVFDPLLNFSTPSGFRKALGVPKIPCPPNKN